MCERPFMPFDQSCDFTKSLPTVHLLTYARSIFFIHVKLFAVTLPRTQENDHGLRGSASPVLTATGFVNGRWQFSTPTE